jgi:CRISPR-associated protein Cmr1
MKIVIKTLTPIITDGVERITDRLRETGIIGSLCWWYENIVCGLGGYACDPTKRCSYNEGLCDVCQLFGAIGWRRRFDLRIVRDKTRPAWNGAGFEISFPPPATPLGTFLPSGMIGNFAIKIRGDADVVGKVASLFLFLEKWGAIGARSDLGYGFFEITNRSEVSECAKKWEIIGQSDIPDLRHWLFFKFRFKPSRVDWWTRVTGLQRLLGNRDTALIVSHLAKQGMVPVSPTINNQWRYVEWNAPFPNKQWLFGSEDSDQHSALYRKNRVSVSWAYREGGVWTVRGWASIPEVERTNSGMYQHRQDVDTLERMLRDEAIWKRALGLDYSVPLSLEVIRLTDQTLSDLWTKKR